MVPKLIARKHKHTNDCWCDAISMATHQPYNKVYRMFKDLCYPSGGLDSNIIFGYLQGKHGYRGFIWDPKESNCLRLKDVCELFNTKDCEIVCNIVYDDEHAHVVYIHNNTFYDIIHYSRTFEEFLKDPVSKMCIKYRGK